MLLTYRSYYDVSIPKSPNLCERFPLLVCHYITVCSLCAGDLELDCRPFPHCIIRNFLSSNTFIESLQSELMGLSFHEKSNDLYKFKQVPGRFCYEMSKTYALSGCRDILFLMFRFFFLARCCCSCTVGWLGDENRAAHCRTEVKKNAIKDDRLR